MFSKFSNFVGPLSPFTNTNTPAVLLMSLDAGNTASYAGGGTNYWNDIVGTNNFFLTGPPAYEPSSDSLYFKQSMNEYGFNLSPIEFLPLETFTIDTWINFKSLPLSVDPNTGYPQLPQIITEVYTDDYHIDAHPLNFVLGFDSKQQVTGGFFRTEGDILFQCPESYPVATDTWYNFTVTYDKKAVILYVNGEEFSRLNSNYTPLSSGLGVKIGKRWDYPEFIDANINLLNIWSGALTKKQISNNFNNYKNKFTLNDASLLFNNSTWLELPDINWEIGNIYTIEFWSRAYSSSIGNTYAIMSQAPNNNSIDIYYNNGSLEIGNGDIKFAEPTPNIWTHVAIVSDGKFLTIYYNGKSKSQTLYTVSISDKSHGLAIGRREIRNDFQYFNGQLYGIRISQNKVIYSNDFNPYVEALPPLIETGTILLINSYQVLSGNFVDLSNNHNIITHGVTYSLNIPIIPVRYFKLTITNVKDINQPSANGAVQISDLVLQYGGVPVNWDVSASATNPSGDYSLSESPDKMLDNDIMTKWCDINFVRNQGSTVYIDNVNPIAFDSYYYITGNDYSGRDPISWTLESSDDNSTWRTIDTQTDVTITELRRTATQVFTIQ